MQLRLLALVLIALVAAPACLLAHQPNPPRPGTPLTPVTTPGKKSPRVDLPNNTQEFQVRPQISDLEDWQLFRLLDNARLERRNERLRKRFEREAPDSLDRLIDRYRLHPRPVLPRAPIFQNEELQATIREMEWEVVMRGFKVRGDELKMIYEDPPELQDPTRPHLDASEETIHQSARSVVAIVKESMMKLEDVDGDDVQEYVMEISTAQEIFSGVGHMCELTGFYDYPATETHGTGFLVADDYIATAQHVYTGSGFLEDVYFVFDYVFLEGLTPRTVFEPEQVYKGTEIIEQAVNTTGHDFMLVKVPASPESNGYAPLPLSDAKVLAASDVYMVGHPLGMPQMYAGMAKARPNSECDYFESTLESYEYFSGSPVFNGVAQEQVEGLHIESRVDVEDFCECSTYVRTGEADVLTSTAQLIQPVAGLLHHRNEVIVVNETGETAWVETTGMHEIPSGETRVIPWSLTMELLQPLDPLMDLAAEGGDPSDLEPYEVCDLDYYPWEGQVWAVRSSPNGTSQVLRTCDASIIAGIP